MGDRNTKTPIGSRSKSGDGNTKNPMPSGSHSGELVPRGSREMVPSGSHFIGIPSDRNPNQQQQPTATHQSGNNPGVGVGNNPGGGVGFGYSNFVSDGNSVGNDSVGNIAVSNSVVGNHAAGHGSNPDNTMNSNPDNTMNSNNKRGGGSKNQTNF